MMDDEGHGSAGRIETAARADDVVDAGAPAAFETFYREHLLAMVRLAHLVTGSNAVAEDLVHDAFLKVRPRFDALDAPAAYLRRTVVNECHQWFRRRDVERRHSPQAEEALELPAELDELWVALRQVPARRRAALFLRFYEDRSITEIAEILDCRPGTVRSLLRRGLASLREVVPDAR
jgi:RNA polymerase sigma factor (sigma-70 family)